MNRTIKEQMETLEPLFKKYRVEELAVKLSVSSSTIFKWKSGKVAPSRMAREKIRALQQEISR